MPTGKMYRNFYIGDNCVLINQVSVSRQRIIPRLLVMSFTILDLNNGKKSRDKRLTSPADRRIIRPVGSLAQLVEPLTLNQLVAGSNPARPTNVNNELAHSPHF